MVATIEKIIDDIEQVVVNKLPFSLIRFGDGGLKFIRAYFNKVPLDAIARKEGIPLWFIDKLIKGWKRAANEADYIDSPIVYLEDKIFSKRSKVSAGTFALMGRWIEVYELIGFKNKNFCNPEIGYMVFAENSVKNLLPILEESNICCITSYYEIEDILEGYAKSVTVKLIPEHFGNHYDVCFKAIMEEIREEANDYDLWLIGAGELGRLYSGKIKRCGGRALDIGKVFDVWATRVINKRMRLIAELSEEHELLFRIGGDCVIN